MPPSGEPADLELQLYRQGSDDKGPFYGLRLSFQLPGSGEREVFSASKPLRFDEDALRERKSGDFSRYGEELARQVLTDSDVRARFDQHLKVAASHAVPLHIRLFLDPNAQSLHGLLWETLRLPGESAPLFSGENRRFSRYLSKGESASASASSQAKSAADVRALVVVAAPRGLDQLRPPLANVDVGRELQTAYDGLGNIPADDLATPGQANIGAIGARLRDGYDILYLVAHGILSTDGEPALCLEKADGTPDWVLGEELVTAIRNLSPDHRPRLVALVSCQSAGADGEWLTTDKGALAGLGPRLAEAGIPAVIAMQGNLKMATAAIFLPVLFRELRRDGQVERAVAVARGEALGKERPDWWMPVLFTRLVDGRVWAPAPAETLAKLERQDFEPETVYIPAGAFRMGSENPNEAPPRDVKLEGYRIGRYPVTNREYQVFLQKTGRLASKEMVWDGQEPPNGKERHPVSGVTWYDALAYCQWLAIETGRPYTLPSAAQWERAARGVDGRVYPWGNDWQDGRCHFGQEGTEAVDKYPAQNEWGCYDMAGNVREWTSTLWGEDAFQPDERYRYPRRPDHLPDDLDANPAIRRIYRGGASSDPLERLRCAASNSFEPSKPGPFGKRHGFRVALILPKAAKA